MKIQLSAFIAVSCLAHVTLLFWTSSLPVPQLHIGGRAESLRVTLLATAASVPMAKEIAALETMRPPPPAPRQRPQTVTAPRNETLPDSARSPTRKPAGQASAPAANSPSPVTASTQSVPQSSSVSVSERVSAALQNQLAEHFEYPWLARKRGWQGLVTLSLHIDANGDVSQWRIARTSGYNVLDRSALEAAGRIDRLQQAERLLGGKSLNLSIPVRYRLIDS
jgi:protein TonB